EKGLIRCQKGHNIDAKSVGFKTGDDYFDNLVHFNLLKTISVRKSGYIQTINQPIRFIVSHYKVYN
ncbi:hypothetical protein, partial [Escherichia coli]|uniref:hypothetical protein n=1 Tax=Escherichia coli TaxID=562 RepID=UPI00293C0057